MIGVPSDPLDTLRRDWCFISPRLDTLPLRRDEGDFSRRTTH